MAEHPSGGPTGPSAARELALARSWLADLDLPHAAVHLAQAVVADPARDDVWALVDEVASADLFPTGDEVYIGCAMVHAHFDARAGRIGAALAALAHILAIEPDRDWLRAPWVVAVARDPLALLSGLHQAAATYRRVAEVSGTTPFVGLLALVRQAVESRPDDVEVAVHASLAVPALGGTVIEGRAWRDRAAGAAPGHLGRIMLGYALRDAGALDGMERAWRDVIEADPAEIDIRVELARSLADRDRRAEADALVTAALAIDPEHPRAVAVRSALRFRDTGEIAELVRLADAARTTGNAALPAILDTACDTLPWLNRVPMPRDTLAMVIRRMASDREGTTVLRTATMAVEAPTAVSVLRRMAPGIGLQVMAYPKPDARQPLAPVEYAVWRYDGAPTATAAYPAPPPDLVTLLHRVANEPWTSPVTGYASAAPFGDRTVEELLGLLGHLPAPPRNDRWTKAIIDPGYWARLASAWVCLGFLHQSAAEPWSGSIRRTVLVDLAHGVEDWTTDAALFALVVAAWVDPTVRDDVHALVRGRLAAARATSHQRRMPIAPSIAELMLITPGVTPAEVSLSRRLIHTATTPPRGPFGRWSREIAYRLGR